MLAIAFHSIGMLGKFYAEEFETAEKGILNAVRGTGATWARRFATDSGRSRFHRSSRSRSIDWR